MNTIFISAALVPIVAFLIRKLLAEPLEDLVKEKLPPKVAEFLTKERGEKRKD